MQIHVVDHPLIKEKMTHLRDKNTAPKEFRQALDQIAQLLLFEVTKDLPVRRVHVIDMAAGDALSRPKRRRLTEATA